VQRRICKLKEQMTMNIKSASINGIFVALSLITVAGGNIARADSVSASSSATVSLAGLDLSTPQGASMARARVHQAARVACSRAVDPYNLAPHWEYINCVDRTEKVALQQIKGPAIVVSK
jgi:UrcA family protein